MSAGLRVDLLEARFTDGFTGRYRWRLWSNSRIIGASTEGYNRRSRAIANLETVTGGTFEKINTTESPTPYGVLVRTRRELIRVEGARSLVFVDQRIPVRLVTE